ncbi:hypothetical protein ACTVZO_05410 [Streptomyces sp. IBSNAI002]|uniref:hypothetical protein n=1 Tax=Streptomyces sp. IBSNAI002 TaxID=3457500 RepID=UPI003FCF0EF3
MHTRTTITTTAAAVLLLAATACNSTTNTPAAPSTPAAPASSASTSPTPSPTPEAPRALGTTISNDDADSGATVTVLGYEQGIKASTTADEEFGTSGYVWAAIEIKVCSTKGTVGVTRNPWVLAYTDGARVQPSGVTYGDFPKPEYPSEADIKAGDCIRGKTVFAVPGNQRPAKILYTSSVLPEPAEWVIPPK